MDNGHSKYAVKDSLVALLREQRGVHRKESFYRKTRCMIVRPDSDCPRGRSADSLSATVIVIF